jgi:hypothetical protein
MAALDKALAVLRGQAAGMLGDVSDPSTSRVSDADRSAMARQAAAWAGGDTADEGTPEWRAEAIRRIDADRARQGIEELDTEPELHRRARDLGLLRRVP